MENLAKRLIKTREDAKLSQAQLAAKAKLKNQSIIGMLESGARKTSSHLPAIANALGVEALWLSSGDGPKSRGASQAYELSETGLKVGVLVSKMTPTRQESLLDYLTVLEAQQEGKDSIEIQQPEKKKLLHG